MTSFIQKLLAESNLGEGHPVRNAIYLIGVALWIVCQIVFLAASAWSPLRGISLTVITILTTAYPIDLFAQRTTRNRLWGMLRDNPTERLVFLAIVVLLITAQIGISRNDRLLAIWSISGWVAIFIALGGYYVTAQHGNRIWSFILSLRRQ